MLGTLSTLLVASRSWLQEVSCSRQGARIDREIWYTPREVNMSFVRSLLNSIGMAPPAIPTQELGRSSSQVNLSAVTFSNRKGGTATSFLLSVEKTAALVGMLKSCSRVQIDRWNGGITLDKAGAPSVTSELLQVAVEYFDQPKLRSALFLSTRSTLSYYMSAEHQARVEEILACAAYDGNSPGSAGRVFTSETTLPYSRKGQTHFVRLPAAFRHGEYEFFTPGQERAALMQFISNLCEPNHVVLPVVQHNNTPPSSSSTLSVKPIWLLAALGDVVASELEKRDPLTRFYELVFDWRKNLRSSVFDLPATLHGLASALGLEITEESPEFEGGFTKFEISSTSSGLKLSAFVSPAVSGGYRDFDIRRGALRPW